MILEDSSGEDPLEKITETGRGKLEQRDRILKYGVMANVTGFAPIFLPYIT